MLFFELHSFKEFIIGLSCTPSLFLNYIKIGNKHVYFKIINLGFDLQNAVYYCILDKKLKYNWINFNPRNFEIKIIPRPTSQPNYNIAIVNCRNTSYIKPLINFLNS
ncbi:MAG: hypothetical protein ACTSQO_05090 [Candidatus Helarchaeota archaeon]